MRYKVYDEEDKKERTLEECVTPLGVCRLKREIPERYIILEYWRN